MGWGVFVWFSAFSFLGWFKTPEFTCLFWFGTAWIHGSDSNPKSLIQRWYIWGGGGGQILWWLKSTESPGIVQPEWWEPEGIINGGHGEQLTCKDHLAPLGTSPHPADIPPSFRPIPLYVHMWAMNPTAHLESSYLLIHFLSRIVQMLSLKTFQSADCSQTILYLYSCRFL